MNYYELFDIPAAPKVDHTAVSKKYFELQRKYHPDFFMDALEEEQEEALAQSAHVNKAYKIFNDPSATLEYYLIAKGVIDPDEKFQLPPDFLGEMMELNEMLEDDPPAATESANAVSSALGADAEEIIKGALDNASLQKLKSIYYQLKYLDRLRARS